MRGCHNSVAGAAKGTACRALPAILILQAVLAVLPAACGRSATSNESGRDADTTRAAGANKLLERELDLASGSDFYFILDAANSKLKMMLSGVVLHEYQVQEFSVGAPRLLFEKRRPPAGWLNRVWRGGGLSPAREWDRAEIVAGEGGAGGEPSEPVIPPTAEEAVDVPAPYWIRFDGGLALEIRARDADGEEVRNGGPYAWLLSAAREVAASVGLPARDRMRLVVYLSEEDAAALYRSAPPDVSFLVAPQ